MREKKEKSFGIILSFGRSGGPASPLRIHYCNIIIIRINIIIRTRYCCQLQERQELQEEERHEQACVEEGAQLQQRHPHISLVMLFGWRGCDGLSLPCFSPRPQLPPLAAYFAYWGDENGDVYTMCSLGL